MKKQLLFLMFIGASLASFAQFGYPHVKKQDIETFKDSRVIVVLFNDSAYNASIKAAMEQYWMFNAGFEFVHDSMMKAYNKPEYSFLFFAKGKKSNKIKAKLNTSEDDFNGLVVATKYRKKAKMLELLGSGFCSNTIDTDDWYPEMVRAVQMLNNFFNYAVQAESDKAIDPKVMSANYPNDLSIISNKKLLIEQGRLFMKGTEDASFIYDNEVEEVDRAEINKAILTQDPEVVYTLIVQNEGFSAKLFISAANSEVMHFEESKPDDLKITARDLKVVKSRINKANK